MPANPPAFPPNAGWRDNDPDCRGMTLRDWFAGQVLPVIHHNGGRYGPEGAAQVAAYAYAFADAMLAERERSQSDAS